MRRALFGLAIVIASACAPEPLPSRGHVALYFDTDAPLPAPPGELPAEGEPTPLFDRLLVEVFEPGKTTPCIGCRREIPLDRKMLMDRRASIQIPTLAGLVGYRVRARLFLASHLAGATEPPPGGVIEVVTALAAAPNEGGVDQTIFLATEEVGVPRGTLAAPAPAIPGAPPASKVGSWEGAKRIPCDEPAREGEACIPGGAFWMGNPSERDPDEATRSDKPRLVVVSPMFIDVDEAAVGESRTIMAAEGAIPWNGKKTGEVFQDYCTFTELPGKNDKLPVNCVAWPTARNYCLARGKELPTEAELEHVAGALASRRFVWGNDPPTCEDAVFGRGGVGYLSEIISPCRTGVFWPACVGPACARARDVFDIDGVTVRDLAGNVSEWALDVYESQDEPCWSGGGVRRDPMCTADDTFDRVRTVRGGSWLSTGSSLTAASRQGRSVRIPRPEIGVRCTRPGITRACGSIPPDLYAGSGSGSAALALTTVGIGCNGIVSALAFRRQGSNAVAIFLSGAATADGAIHFEGRDVADLDGVGYRFVGKAVAATRLEGTWTATTGEKGTWGISPK